jgi:hypothetical protein
MAKAQLLRGETGLIPAKTNLPGLIRSSRSKRSTASLRSKRFKAAALQEVIITLLKASGDDFPTRKNRPLPGM